MINVLKDMLLIEDPSVFRLYQELIKIANYFVAPVFTIALLLEYFGEMNFAGTVKKLFIVILFMGLFYGFHTEGTRIALDSANQTLRRVSPTNLFVKKWTQTKVKTQKQKGWDSLKSILVPNLNDLIGTAFFLLAKIFIWLLKLIYSSVYHLTYVFAGVTAILYFLGWTKDALKGTIQASLWCMIMPFVIVAILSLVGNSIEATALSGDLVIAKIDTIIWLFGVTLLLLITPLITYGMIRGDGIHSFGSKMGSMVVSSGLKAMAFYPMIAGMLRNSTQGMGKASSKAFFEPSINELLGKDKTSNKSKMNDLNKKGNLKSPLSKSRPLEDRLKEVGLTKDEAFKLSKDSSAYKKAKQAHGRNISEGLKKTMPQFDHQSKSKSKIGKLEPINNGNNKSDQFVPLRKQNFKFNQKYWDGINPHKAEAIKKKYGIKTETVDPNKVHRPAIAKKLSSKQRGSKK